MDPVVSIPYYSGYGHTAVLAGAVRDGASAAGARTHLIDVANISHDDWNALDASEAIVFGAPTYMGAAAAGFWTFAEATSGRWQEQRWKDKLAAGFTNSGGKSGDKLNTLQNFAVLAAQHGMLWISLGLTTGWNSAAGSENDLNRLGFFLGAGAQTFVDAGPDGVHPADIATCEWLGRRVTETTRIFTMGRRVVETAVAD
ncbi:flavodoxin family protein [Nocardia sp. CDC159]|uniref:Flavodoxin family protein n=1 Tax=Nocardia pulmonis TaxID=2951408 RepID=A0A9X2EIT8_9NOCA|nr:MULTISPECIES: flavodoxin family protein [Nocardia]MCM6778921.1 flavodoxin family protein [Nocardia pulmonis]MCM6791826.1 flavodoxin family protein [Nocardia sp. CDC159]